jgi:hypothetical protein
MSKKEQELAKEEQGEKLTICPLTNQKCAWANTNDCTKLNIWLKKGPAGQRDVSARLSGGGYCSPMRKGIKKRE